MECNKDEAARAKSIADAKLELNDFAGAKIYALKAQTLHPGLSGISQMLKTIDVHVSSEKMINGQVDWYGVLEVGPEADVDSIKKQYRKLALMLHPDKNNSSGANGAFKLISEAWGLLSDKAKRSAYDLITGRKQLQPKDPTNLIRPIPPTWYPGGSCSHSGGPPNPTAGSPCTQPASAKRKPAAPKPRKKSAKTAPPASQRPSTSAANQAVESFWTMCGKCKVEYEYHNLYRYMILLCPCCKTPFVASVIPRSYAPRSPNNPSPSPSVPTQQQQRNTADDNNINNNNYYYYNYNNSGAPASGNNYAWRRM